MKIPIPTGRIIRKFYIDVLPGYNILLLQPHNGKYQSIGQIDPDGENSTLTFHLGPAQASLTIPTEMLRYHLETASRRTTVVSRSSSGRARVFHAGPGLRGAMCFELVKEVCKVNVNLMDSYFSFFLPQQELEIAFNGNPVETGNFLTVLNNPKMTMYLGGMNLTRHIADGVSEGIKKNMIPSNNGDLIIRFVSLEATDTQTT